LVDDAIIAVEMMATKMEQGWERFKAASFAYKSTAFPMLTGTLITVAGFLPVGFAKSSAGEYTFSIFAVVTTALLVSWVVAVVFIPYLGFKLLPDFQARSDKWARYLSETFLSAFPASRDLVRHVPKDRDRFDCPDICPVDLRIPVCAKSVLSVVESSRIAGRFVAAARRLFRGH